MFKKPHSFLCPRCVQAVAPGAEHCVHCGFSLAIPAEVMGVEPVYVARVADHAEALSDAAKERVERIVQGFEARFPQLFLIVCLGSPPAQMGLRQFGFWLLNHAAPPHADATRPNERGLLLLIDVQTRVAALVGGYFLECYLLQEELDAVLRAGKGDLVRGQWERAVDRITKGLAVLLTRRAAAAAVNPVAFAPVRPPAAAPHFPRLAEPRIEPPEPSRDAGGPPPSGRVTVVPAPDIQARLRKARANSNRRRGR